MRKNFPAFYAELFDATVAKMGRKVVVTEYAWQTTGCDPCPTPPLHGRSDLVDAGRSTSRSQRSGAGADRGGRFYGGVAAGC